MAPIESAPTGASQEFVTTSQSIADRLRASTAALRLSLKALGTRKAISPLQLADAAEHFGAEPEFVSGSKRLIDTSATQFRAVRAVQTEAVNYWRSISLPFPQPGIRLVRRDRIDVIDERLHDYRAELQQRALELEADFDALKVDAQSRLGELYNSADYPESVASAFDLQWSFPSVEAPDYLRELSPNLYHEQCRLARERFDQAIELIQTGLIAELRELIQHLRDSLNGVLDGSRRIIRASALGNFHEFFDRFRELNVGAGEELQAFIDQLQEMLGDVRPEQVRRSRAVREDMAAAMADVWEAFEQQFTAPPRRRILRTPR